VKETMPRPDHPRVSKLRDREGDADVNRCGGWSREKLQAMDKRFAEAMERALRGREADMREWLNGADEAGRK
jgi:hypothetical protein